MADVAQKLDPEVLPEYVPSAVLVGEAREEAVRMMLRLAEHVRNKTTRPGPRATGASRWRTTPTRSCSGPRSRRCSSASLPLALSCELPGKNSYKAIEAVGQPRGHHA